MKRIDENALKNFDNKLIEAASAALELKKSDFGAFNIFGIKYFKTDSFLNKIVQDEEDNIMPYIDLDNDVRSAAIIPNCPEVVTIEQIGCRINFSEQDVLDSQVEIQSKGKALIKHAVRANLEVINDTCFKGHQNSRTTGLLNNKHISKSKKVENSNWADRKTEEVIADIRSAFDEIQLKTKGNKLPDTLLISHAVFIDLDQTIYNEFATIKNIISCRELDGAFEGNSHGFVLFNNDENHVYQAVGQLFETSNPQLQGWEYTVFCRSSYGGLVINYPQMFAIRHGI